MSESLIVVGGHGEREIHARHLFLVRAFDLWAGFATCSEISVEHADIDYFEGGSEIPTKMPGRVTYPDVTLERGSTISQKLYEWFMRVSNASINPARETRGSGSARGTGAGGYKTDVLVEQLDRTGSVVLVTYTLKNAYPKSFKAGSWDNNTDEANIESLTLRYDYFLRRAGAATASGPASQALPSVGPGNKMA